MSTWRNLKTQTLTLETLTVGTEFILYDTETTGLNAATDQIIELGAIKCRVDENEGKLFIKIIDTLHLYFKPPFAVKELIVDLTGISNEFLSTKNSIFAEFEKIQNFFGNHPIVAGYNVEFDNKFLMHAYEMNDSLLNIKTSLDVLEMARDRVKKGETENYKLGTIADYFGLNDFEFHSALEDAKCTLMLLEIFFNEYQEQPTIQASNLIKPNIVSVCFWEGFKGNSRIYVNTDCGTLYYDIRAKIWADKDADLSMLDMSYVEKCACSLTGSSNVNEFAKFKGKVLA